MKKKTTAIATGAFVLCLLIGPLAARAGEQPEAETSKETAKAKAPERISFDAMPRGITVLAPATRKHPDWPVIHIRVRKNASPSPAGRRSAGGYLSDLALEDDEPTGVASDSERVERRRSPARHRRPDSGQPPTLSEQLGQLEPTEGLAGTVLEEEAAWEPESDLPERDPALPYPWNPSRFIEPAVDPAWWPKEAFSERNPALPYPWNPSRFAPPIIDPRWVPEDTHAR